MKYIFLKSRIFRHFFMTYLLTAGAIILIFAGAYIYSVHAIFQNAYEDQELLLEETGSEIDAYLSALEDITNMLLSNEKVIQAGYITEETPENSLYFSEVQKSISYQNNVFDSKGSVYLYFSASDSLLASFNRFTASNLDSFSEYYMNFDIDALRPYLNLKKSEYCVLHPDTEKADLVYITPILDNENLTFLGQIVVDISSSSMLKPILNNESCENSYFYMVKDDTAIFFQILENGKYKVSETAPEILNYSGDNFAVIQGRKYLIVDMDGYEDWTYRIAVPRSSIVQKTSVYTVLLIIGVITALLLSFILAAYYSIKATQPVQHLAETLKMQGGENYSATLALTENMVQKYQSTVFSNQKEIHALKRQSRDSYFIGLLHGRYSEEQMTEQAEMLGYPLEHFGTSRMIAFRFDHVQQAVTNAAGETDYNLLQFIIRNVIENILLTDNKAGDYGFFVLPEMQNGVCLCPVNKNENLESKLNQVLSFFRDNLKIDVFIIVGRENGNIQALPEIYQELSDAVGFKRFWGADGKNITYAEEIQEDETSRNRSKEKLRLLNAITIRQYDVAREILISYINESFSNNFHNFRREQYKIYGLVSDIIEQMEGVESEENKDPEVMAILSEISEMSTFSELRDAVLTIFDHLTALQQKLSSEEQPKWMIKAKEYIEDHYNDPNLNISALAEMYNLTASHFSRTFKKYENTGVLDYINMIRIMHAKELLEKETSVHETATAVGYIETRALIRYFKRYENMTPGEYQEKTANR